jgi:phenylacetate-CoA ligase
MAFFHLRTRPETASPPLSGLVREVWSAYQELDQTQWLRPAELEQLQLRLLRPLLVHCFHQVPYYRRLLSELGLFANPIDSLADFRRLPLLTRQLYQTHFADLQARSLPVGTMATGEGYTSGTNGVPIKVLKTSRTDLLWQAFSLRDLEWCGLDPRGRLAAIRLLAKSRKDLPQLLRGVTLPCWNKLLDPLLITGTSAGMDIRQDPRLQLAWLRHIDPDYLVSMPSNLEFLAGLVQESGERLPHLQVIQAISEALADATRQRIEEGFGARVTNLYSTTEAGYMATSCPAGHGLHIHGENVLVEVLDAENRPCLPGQTGRLVFTTLHNFRTPFLRYEILDDVTLAAGPCPCGRGLPLLTHIDGRRHPLLHLPGGARKAISGLYLEIRKVGGCHQFQIIQRAVEHVILRVVPDRSWSPDHATRMIQVVQQEFAAPIRVEVQEKERLDLPAGGKLKIAIIEMDGDAR